MSLDFRELCNSIGSVVVSAFVVVAFKMRQRSRTTESAVEIKKSNSIQERSPIETDQMILISACFHFNRPVKVGAKTKGRNERGEHLGARAHARNSKLPSKGKGLGFGDTGKVGGIHRDEGQEGFG